MQLDDCFFFSFKGERSTSSRCTTPFFFFLKFPLPCCFFFVCLFLTIRPRFTAEKSRFSVSVTCLHLTSAERAVVSIEQQKSCAFFFLFLILLSLFIFFFLLSVYLPSEVLSFFFFRVYNHNLFFICCCCFCECYQGKFLGKNPPFNLFFFFLFLSFLFFFFMMTK